MGELSFLEKMIYDFGDGTRNIKVYIIGQKAKKLTYWKDYPDFENEKEKIDRNIRIMTIDDEWVCDDRTGEMFVQYNITVSLWDDGDGDKLYSGTLD